jgi:hypothetical protein
MSSATSHTDISSADMRAAGFSWDPTFSGYERWTHFKKCITCLRQPYMTDQQWEAAKRGALALANPTDEDVAK